MRLSIITPTIIRPSLRTACSSVSKQSFADWEHIVVLDRFLESEQDKTLIESLSHPQRMIVPCDYPRNNFGNGPRNRAWEFTSGDYLVYLDCDNRFIDHDALQRIHDCLQREPEAKVALFPILRHGQRFFNLPPGLCQTDSANFVLRREIAQWPDIREYTADGIFIERLVAEYGYISFPDCAPIITVPISSEGQ